MPSLEDHEESITKLEVAFKLMASKAYVDQSEARTAKAIRESETRTLEALEEAKREFEETARGFTALIEASFKPIFERLGIK